jgi:hypothetical protein
MPMTAMNRKPVAIAIASTKTTGASGPRIRIQTRRSLHQPTGLTPLREGRLTVFPDVGRFFLRMHGPPEQQLLSMS